MSRLRPFVRRYGFDVLLIAAALESAFEIALRRSGTPPTVTHWFAVPAVAILVLALLSRRRWPFGAPASLWLLAAAASFVDGRLVVFTSGVYVAGLAAALLLGNLADERQARLGLATVLGSAAVVVANDPGHSPGELVFIPIMFGIGWLVGFALRERTSRTEAAEARASQAERERELAARIAVAEERARIARELHDIVAHAVAVMVLQVGAVRHRLPEELAPNREALQSVEHTGRSALVEMRRLLGAMRSDGEAVELTPRPGLGSLEPLLDQVRGAGLPVQLQVEGQPVPLPEALDLSAYRIVQEGLTNALKHAGADRADVVLRYGAGELTIDVRDDGQGSAGGDGAGHGLLGIRERVKLYGGELSAGRVNGGGFVLSARLPLEGQPR